MVIVLIGAPGSGKGTQGQFLAKALDCPYLSTGEIFRSIVANQDIEAKLINEYSSQGKLVPSDLVNTVVYKFLIMNEYKEQCVLDGYPRNLNQAEFLDSKQLKNIKAIYFDISEQLAEQRILGRFSCGCCDKIYNRYFARPAIEDVCDVCGSREFKCRIDDEQKIVEHRMQEYIIETQPVVQYYRKCNKLLTIDASQTQEQISSVLLRLI